MVGRDAERLRQFEAELGEIVGTDLAHTLVLYARNPTPLEAEFLRNDGFTNLGKEQRAAVLALIDRYRSGAR